MLNPIIVLARLEKSRYSLFLSYKLTFKIYRNIKKISQTWLVTGVAGFIGSNIAEFLLNHNQKVIGLDNFATGSRINVSDIYNSTPQNLHQNFDFIEGDILDQDLINRLVEKSDHILHLAALGSVPRSIANPIRTNKVNIEGSLNIFWAAKQYKKKVVYASSSTVYGDTNIIPQQELNLGNQLSPYAVSKLAMEKYAQVWNLRYEIDLIGLRLFNVFGRRQNPRGKYICVIPKWICEIHRNIPIEIYGDGETMRDFSYIDNVIQAFVLAATSSNQDSWNQVYNIAVGKKTNLKQLFSLLKKELLPYYDIQTLEPIFTSTRAGDMRTTHADITNAKIKLGYNPEFTLEDALKPTVEWYVDTLKTNPGFFD
ncbi:MAG: NAD-dependent epimerase/dehydratase family protein [Rickettsiales bacterium]|nr:NAD-dependent epimerase/dehydratase family protein [Rickettsiales bacterium]